MFGILNKGFSSFAKLLVLGQTSLTIKRKKKKNISLFNGNICVSLKWLVFE